MERFGVGCRHGRYVRRFGAEQLRMDIRHYVRTRVLTVKRLCGHVPRGQVPSGNRVQYLGPIFPLQFQDLLLRSVIGRRNHDYANHLQSLRTRFRRGLLRPCRRSRAQGHLRPFAMRFGHREKRKNHRRRIQFAGMKSRIAPPLRVRQVRTRSESDRQNLLRARGTARRNGCAREKSPRTPGVDALFHSPRFRGESQTFGRTVLHHLLENVARFLSIRIRALETRRLRRVRNGRIRRRFVRLPFVTSQRKTPVDDGGFVCFRLLYFRKGFWFFIRDSLCFRPVRPRRSELRSLRVPAFSAGS